MKDLGWSSEWLFDNSPAPLHFTIGCRWTRNDKENFQYNLVLLLYTMGIDPDAEGWVWYDGLESRTFGSIGYTRPTEGGGGDWMAALHTTTQRMTLPWDSEGQPVYS